MYVHLHTFWYTLQKNVKNRHLLSTCLCLTSSFWHLWTWHVLASLYHRIISITWFYEYFLFIMILFSFCATCSKEDDKNGRAEEKITGRPQGKDAALVGWSWWPGRVRPHWGRTWGLKVGQNTHQGTVDTCSILIFVNIPIFLSECCPELVETLIMNNFFDERPRRRAASQSQWLLGASALALLASPLRRLFKV